MTLVGRLSATGSRPAGAARRLKPGRLARALRGTAQIGAMLSVTAIGLGIAAFVAGSGHSAGQAAATPAADPRAWIEIRRPIQLYSIEGSGFDKEPLTYTAKRSPFGGGRKDQLSFGDLRMEQPYLALALYRVGGEAGRPPPLTRDVADLATDNGFALAQTSAPTSFATRFGPFQAIDLRLLRNGFETPCLGFGSALDGGSVLRVSGLACGTRGKPIGRDVLACLIDRIGLVSAGDDISLRDTFARAERGRGRSCATSWPSATGKARGNWLEAGSGLLPFKGALERDEIISGHILR